LTEPFFLLIFNLNGGIQNGFYIFIETATPAKIARDGMPYFRFQANWPTIILGLTNNTVPYSFIHQ
jgi:hypothetical protein